MRVLGARAFGIASVLLPFFVLGAAAFGSSYTPQKSLRGLGGRPGWVPICSRRGINGSAPWADITSTALMDQQACVSPSWGTITSIKLVYAAFDMPQQGEVDRPVTATGTSAVFVPSLNTFSVTGGASVAAGSLQLNPFPGTGLGANGISLGQTVSSAGGGLAAGSYVTSVNNSFNPGAGNQPLYTVVGITPPTTAATANGQPFTFGGLFVPVKYGGKRSFTIEPSHDVITSDPVSVEIQPSTWFLIRTSAVFSGSGLQLMDLPVTSRITVSSGAGSFSEFDNRSTTVNDQTMTPVSLSNTGGGYWGPVMVLAQVTPSAGQVMPGAVMVLGDSIAAGTGDIPDTLGLEGYIQRSLENNVPFVTAARGSTTAFALAVHGDGQYALSIDAGITDVLLEPGRNDLEQFGLSAAAVESSITSVAARYASAGKRVWCFTVPPTTYSSDAWNSLGNQGFPYTVNQTGQGSIPLGSTNLAMQSVANIAVGQSVGSNGSSNVPAQAIAAGSVVTAVSPANSTITVSRPTNSTIAPGTSLYFGVSSGGASPLEIQRTAYNTFARANWKGAGGPCYGLIDVDSIFSDPAGSGKWRSDLGQATLDGVHPSPALHQAAVNAGIITSGMFLPQ